MSTNFTVEFYFTYLGNQDWEEDTHNYITMRTKDSDWFADELSDYMPIWDMAHDELPNDAIEGRQWRVVISGSMRYATDFFGEVDGDYDIHWLHAEEVGEHHEDDDSEVYHLTFSERDEGDKYSGN